jgi:O-glycosyl hydrolase
MRQRLSTLVFGLFCALVSLPGCDPAEPRPVPEGDSHTNWLRSCSADAECGELSCRCGLCTRACSDDSACDGVGGACIAASEVIVAGCPGLEPAEPRLCLPASSVRIQVDTSTALQTLVGFGATIGYAEDELAALSDRTALDSAMFAGLGLDVLRVRNRFTEVSDARLAQATELVNAAERSLGRRPLVLLSSWSPPPALKQNGATFCAGGPASCTLLQKPDGGFDYSSFAQHWRETLLAYARVGFTPDYVGIQNNPDWAPVSGAAAEACKFLPTEGDEDVLVDGALKPVRYPGYAEALAAVSDAIADLPARPRLLAPELAGVRGAERYFQALDASRIDAIAHHLYGSVASQPDLLGMNALDALGSSMALPVFQTEMQAGGFDTALLIHHALVSEGAAMYLQTALVAPRSGPATNPSALIGLEQGDFVLQAPYFAMQHYALFTDPGYVRVATTTSAAGVLVSAWRAPQGSALTLVAINTGAVEQVVELDVGAPRSFRAFRTVFDGAERMAPLGSLAPGTKLSLPPRSMLTARFE